MCTCINFDQGKKRVLFFEGLRVGLRGLVLERGSSKLLATLSSHRCLEPPTGDPHIPLKPLSPQDRRQAHPPERCDHIYSSSSPWDRIISSQLILTLDFRTTDTARIIFRKSHGSLHQSYGGGKISSYLPTTESPVHNNCCRHQFNRSNTFNSTPIPYFCTFQDSLSSLLLYMWIFWGALCTIGTDLIHLSSATPCCVGPVDLVLGSCSVSIRQSGLNENTGELMHAIKSSSFFRKHEMRTFVPSQFCHP